MRLGIDWPVNQLCRVVFLRMLSHLNEIVWRFLCYTVFVLVSDVWCFYIWLNLEELLTTLRWGGSSETKAVDGFSQI